jgi:hypothetical protein
MPGAPALFTQKTVILCHAGSNSGKTTLCRFMEKDDVYVFSTDMLYSGRNLKKSGLKSNGFDKYLKKMGKTHTVPLHTIINKLSGFTDTNYCMEYCDYVCQYLRKIFDENQDIKVILVEGFQIHFPNILEQLSQRLKGTYMCWDMSRI